MHQCHSRVFHSYFVQGAREEGPADAERAEADAQVSWSETVKDYRTRVERVK